MTRRCPRCGFAFMARFDEWPDEVSEGFTKWAIEKYPARRQTIIKWRSWTEVPQYLREEYRRKLKSPNGANSLRSNERTNLGRGGPERNARSARTHVHGTAQPRVRQNKT